ncbi:hypothetical protein [Cysteiniphilum sp. 6C5]|uniref:hypothetical protein n=1 Tax=unclassified Cysteiniphilum TaxID=2610889 RepID=UPI003F839093
MKIVATIITVMLSYATGVSHVVTTGLNYSIPSRLDFTLSPITGSIHSNSQSVYTSDVMFNQNNRYNPSDRYGLVINAFNSNFLPLKEDNSVVIPLGKIDHGEAEVGISHIAFLNAQNNRLNLVNGRNNANCAIVDNQLSFFAIGQPISCELEFSGQALVEHFKRMELTFKAAKMTQEQYTGVLYVTIKKTL